ncbi:LOW QUALITY PROTEIN: DC-STAMP domain-containing protein 2 [Opisthocomus hoazin]|uniref:LOW QUALITY PROTEIN: DC-STAMP domain-containing protein 2 n=1 Tax=Opisthocomus hoazin TaxID=30419 RepID=UPI003F52BA00
MKRPFCPPYSQQSLGEQQEPGRARPSMGLVSWLRNRRKSAAPLSEGRRPRQKRRSGEESTVRELGRSFGGLVLGLVLASLYGALVLLAQGHNVWYCLVTTISLGAGMGLGMAFSAKVRVIVLLSLPHAFTKEGKMLMLLLALGMAVQGPCTNILHNFSRSAESLSCGAELALNQTAEQLQRAREPLMNALAKIKDISQKAKVVSDHVRKLFRSVIDSVTYVARTIRTVWVWLAHMGHVCNRELGTPYRRCMRLFDEAQDNCKRTIPLLFFLCYIISAVRPLCGLANVTLFFCIVPLYIQSFLRRNIAVPINIALDRIRREFEFNISTTHRFEVNLNASKSLSEVALDIMESVRLHMEPARRFLALFTHFTFLAMLYLYLQALRYRHRYLRDDTFDNIYITRRFVELDLQRAEQGRPTALPLTVRERRRYVPPAAWWLSRPERLRYGLQLVGVLRHVVLGVCIILADYSLFWLLDLIRNQLQGEIVARAPVVMGVSVDGAGYTSDIFRDLVSAFDALQQGNVSVLSQRCLLHPVEPDYNTYISMGILYGICLFIALFGGHMARLRRAVCAAYYPSREQERTVFLHSTILARRAGLLRALRRATTRNAADAAEGNLLLYLTSRLPGFARLARFFGIQQKFCLGCGAAQQPDFTACLTPNCKGLYCSECSRTLRNVCTVCMGPLTYGDTSDEEMDSSDEEKVQLWLGALQNLEGQEKGRLLRRRIREVAGGRGGSRQLPPALAARLRAQLKDEASGESDGGDSRVDSEHSSVSSLDFSYQERHESSGSELEEVVAAQQPPSSKGMARSSMSPSPGLWCPQFNIHGAPRLSMPQSPGLQCPQPLDVPVPKPVVAPAPTPWCPQPFDVPIPRPVVAPAPTL